MAGWVFLLVGIVLGVYGKYFFDPVFRVSGIVVGMIGVTLLLWRKDGTRHLKRTAQQGLAVLTRSTGQQA
jgi:xanthine/uracil permease